MHISRIQSFKDGPLSMSSGLSHLNDLVLRSWKSTLHRQHRREGESLHLGAVDRGDLMERGHERP